MTMKNRLIMSVRVYFWVFFAVIWAVSTLDFFDHVTRENTSDFRDAWPAWLGFTVGSTLCITLLLLAGHLLGPRRGHVRLVIDLLVCMAAFPFHVYFTGPIMDRVFWDGGLVFDGFSPVLLLPAAMLYLVVRGVLLAGSLGLRAVRGKPRVIRGD
jgi:hypothetical protein